MCILQTNNLKKYYSNSEVLVKALDGISLAIEKGEFVSIVGSSGSGKSTLLHMLGGLDYPSSGIITVEGKNLEDMSKDELTVFRRQKIGFIFQNFNLLPLLNVYENIIFPIELDSRIPDKVYVEEVIEMLGLSSKIFAMPNELSGGQQQRVAIARALVAKPAIILADEPTGNLDSKMSEEVMNLLKKTNSKLSQTIVMITHNPELAKMTNRIIEISDGKIRDGVVYEKR